MKPIATIIVLLLSLTGFTANAQTQHLSSVDDAINIALQNNQAIKASDLEIDASKALKKNSRKNYLKLDFNAQLGQYNSTKFDQSFQVSANHSISVIIRS